MSEYILKRKAIDAVYAGIKLYHDEHHPLKVVYDYIFDAIGEIETEDVAPVVHAYWIGVEGDGYAEDENGEMQIVYDVFECSHCGCEHLADGEPEWTYCPNCGAIMDLEPPIWKERE